MRTYRHARLPFDSSCEYQGRSDATRRLSPCVPIASSRTAPPPASLGDLLLGDPRRGHPVAAFGRAAAAVERRLWRDHRGWGALHTALCAGGAAARRRAVSRAAYGPSPAASVALTAAATWAVVGGTSLGREARAIGGALAAGDVEAARERLPHLCGRDPQALDEQQIARAVVESVAENTSDAVVGALVWGALGGVPGLVGFRAVNTLDAMVGHKSPRYRRFGWASARLDDVAGWPGARLTAALAVARRAGSARRRTGLAGRRAASTRAPTRARWRPRSRARSAYGSAAPSRTAAGSSTGRCSTAAGAPVDVRRHRTRRTAVAPGRLARPRRRCRRRGSLAGHATACDGAQERGDERHRGGGLLVAGTTSDAGKSVVTAGICRWLVRQGRQGRAVQGAEHVAQFVRDARGRRDRAGAGDAGAGRPGRADRADESRAAQARASDQQQPGRADGQAGGRDECRAATTAGRQAGAARHGRGVPGGAAGHV